MTLSVRYTVPYHRQIRYPVDTRRAILDRVLLDSTFEGECIVSNRVSIDDRTRFSHSKSRKRLCPHIL